MIPLLLILGQLARWAAPSVQPEVHSVRRAGDVVEIRSAGISLTYMGPFVSPAPPEDRVHQYVFRVPFAPKPAAGAHTAIRPGIAGVFRNGVAIPALFDGPSYEGRNLWHFDPVPGAPMGAYVRSLLEDGSRHSPLIGYALDGYPIYGPWGFDGGGLRRMRSSYRLRKLAARIDGPAIDAYPLGTFAEDYEYAAGSGDLDEHNGRFARTPEYPQGTYAYFLSTFPYLIGPTYYGEIDPDALDAAVQDGATTVAPRIALPAKTAPQRARLSFTAGARHLETVHERPMHLVVVSEDLEYFAHIHPQLAAGDRFEIEHEFPRAGRYQLYLEYTKPAEGVRLESFTLDVTEGGAAARHAPKALAIGLKHPPLRAGDDLTLRFSMPVNDLEPYFGAWAHVIVIGGEPRSFLHAHPLEAAPVGTHTHTAPVGPSPAVIEIVTAFPHPGTYRLWIQAQRGGEVYTTPFDVEVSATAPKRAPSAIPAGAILVTVDGSGFSPARVEAPAGRPVTLAFRRSAESNCASSVVVPSLNLRRDLPMGETTVVALPAMDAGEIRFACGMGMYRGSLVVR